MGVLGSEADLPQGGELLVDVSPARGRRVPGGARDAAEPLKRGRPGEGRRRRRAKRGRSPFRRPSTLGMLKTPEQQPCQGRAAAPPCLLPPQYWCTRAGWWQPTPAHTLPLPLGATLAPTYTLVGVRAQPSLVLSWIGSEPKDVPVRVPDPHLARPGKVLGGPENHGTTLTVLAMEGFDVFNAEPHPCSGVALIVLRQVDAGPVPAYACEVVTAPFGVGEAQNIDVVPHAAGQANDIQDRSGMFEPGSSSAACASR